VQPTIGFTGHVNDVDTGLTYMQQRYYDPVAGRFLSIDPVVTDANNGGSFNRYAYASNSPYKYIDPDGREACPGQSASRCIMADNFNSKKSNGQTTVATEAMDKVMVENKSSVAVSESGSQEKIAFVVSEGAGLSVKSGTDVQTGSTSTTEFASATAPAGTVGVFHGHIDGAMNLVSPKDAAPLKQGLPNGVVSNGRVGVTEIVGGRLQFRMLEGRMETTERRDQQKMLDSQQTDFEK
jgi:RHS repeat-associated protein